MTSERDLSVGDFFWIGRGRSGQLLRVCRISQAHVTVRRIVLADFGSGRFALRRSERPELLSRQELQGWELEEIQRADIFRDRAGIANEIRLQELDRGEELEAFGPEDRIAVEI